MLSDSWIYYCDRCGHGCVKHDNLGEDAPCDVCGTSIPYPRVLDLNGADPNLVQLVTAVADAQETVDAEIDHDGEVPPEIYGPRDTARAVLRAYFQNFAA